MNRNTNFEVWIAGPYIENIFQNDRIKPEECLRYFYTELHPKEKKMINLYNCTENAMFFLSFSDVETRNRNFYTAKRNNKWALVNLQGKARWE